MFYMTVKNMVKDLHPPDFSPLVSGQDNKGFSRPRHLQGKLCKTLAWSDRLEIFLPLTLCNFDPLYMGKYDVLEEL